MTHERVSRYPLHSTQRETPIQLMQDYKLDTLARNLNDKGNKKSKLYNFVTY